jgi:glycosyltransferase involved in cell wall biosynthesis
LSAAPSSWWVPIVLLGRRPYAAMPGYLHAFDACLVPFARSRLTAGVNPIKLREYLAAGRPTVATDLPEVRPYGYVVETVDAPVQWPQAVARALANDDEGARARRRASVAGDSWERTADRVEALIRPLLDDKR